MLRMCMDSGASISQIGRELGITRQGAGKLVANLVNRGYVTSSISTASGRENVVLVTTRDVTTSPHYAGPVGRSTRSCDDPWERLPSPHLSASQGSSHWTTSHRSACTSDLPGTQAPFGAPRIEADDRAERAGSGPRRPCAGRRRAPAPRSGTDRPLGARRRRGRRRDRPHSAASSAALLRWRRHPHTIASEHGAVSCATSFSSDGLDARRVPLACFGRVTRSPRCTGAGVTAHWEPGDRGEGTHQALRRQARRRRSSFEVKPGHVTGFLGPNGAGKSTTMRMIMGLDAPNAAR